MLLSPAAAVLLGAPTLERTPHTPWCWSAQQNDNDGGYVPIWIPLQGPTGERPKAPKVAGWQSPSYEGVDPSLASVTDWLGLRCDDLVVIDCDSQDAAEFWEKHVGAKGMAGVWARKTPRGYHYIYEWTPGAPTGPSVAIFPGIDVRAGRTSQIVFHADGYKTITRNDLCRRYEA